MGALTGSITTTAYYVDGALPDAYEASFVEALNQRRFKEIDLNLDADESVGWVNLNDPFDAELSIEKLKVNHYLVVGLRQDLIRIPAAAFRLHLRRAVQDYLDAKGKERATKAEQEESRDHLEKTLRRKVMPAIKVHEIVWNLQRGEVWFFSSNKRMNELFTDLFAETFGLPLIPRNPYSRLERMAADFSLVDKAITVEPSSFAVPPSMR